MSSFWKLRVGVVAAAGALAVAVASAGSAAAAGGGNAGDVWTDNVGQPAGPGHEQDPHLACQNINLWGAGLADGSGTYTIDGWAPSGSQEQDYASTWTYDTAAGGKQVTSVIDVKRLIDTAAAHGDAPVNKQGFHFKLQFSQDPQKHKTFWVNCPAPTTPGTPGGTPGGTGQPGTPPPSDGTPSAGTPSQGGTVVSLQPPKGSLHKKHHHKHHTLVHPKRHHRPVVRNLGGARVAAPEFTG
jgi:hypothetical protein